MATNPTNPVATGATSLSDILTAVKNIVTALATVATDYLNVQGQLTYYNITAPTMVKSSAGRLCSISVVVNGTAAGIAYDAKSVNDTTRALAPIPAAAAANGEPYIINMPTTYGLLISPGSGQTLAVSYS